MRKAEKIAARAFALYQGSEYSPLRFWSIYAYGYMRPGVITSPNYIAEVVQDIYTAEPLFMELCERAGK